MQYRVLTLAVFCIVAGSPWSKAQSIKRYDKTDGEKIHHRVLRQIALGTKWCGNGDKAANDDDLGYYRETDKCCREHDKCPMNIGGKKVKYGLQNPHVFTRSHCDCDKRFFDCLTDASTRMSRTIGEIYFNFIGEKCFREKTCPAGTSCDNVYEWVDGTTWLPTRDELKKMYQMMALLEPELEIDPFEDYIIGPISNATNQSIVDRNVTKV